MFGSHSSVMSNKRKCCEWQHIVTTVNSVSGTERTMAEVKKKWSDLKVEAIKQLTHHHKSMSEHKVAWAPRVLLSPAPVRHKHMVCLEGARTDEFCAAKSERNN
ncbi:hypothetical protein CHARACLAT_028249 [Characodon lateralis]|uniref:Myb/SANT-like DNA-binding domain-containing protein n=1 Tax=Characodon lateralis TaxID=208331 RepID=A0ABU7EXP8_9TELE|nr:hypothetical protein [Characodon lateralis]